MNPYPRIVQPRATPAPVGSRWSFACAPVGNPWRTGPLGGLPALPLAARRRSAATRSIRTCRPRRAPSSAPAFARQQAVFAGRACAPKRSRPGESARQRHRPQSTLVDGFAFDERVGDLTGRRLNPAFIDEVHVAARHARA
eukprot:801814-Prymnesium_polylepis.2